MSKNKIFIIIVIIAIIAGGVGWYAYNRHQAALAAEKARQEAAAKAEAEKKAKLEATEKAIAEEKATKEAFKVDEQGRTPLEQQWADAKEISDKDLTPEDKAKIEALNKKYAPEFDAIKKLLTDYNRAQNEYDYRTFTGREGEEYMCPETAANHAKVNAPKWKEDVTSRKRVRKFDGVTVRSLVFTTEDFSQIAENPDNPTYAYAEVEVRAHDVEPVKEETSKALAAVWLKKIDGQWKIYAEKPLETN